MKKKILAAFLCVALLIPAAAQAVSATAASDEPAVVENVTAEATGLVPKAFQLSAPYELNGTEVFNIRFVSLLDSLDYTALSVTISEEVTGKQWLFDVPTVYTTLTAQSKDGVSYKNVTAEDLGGEAGQYIVGSAIIGVPADLTLSFSIVTTATTADGTVLTSETRHAYIIDAEAAALGDAPEFPIPLELDVPSPVTFTENKSVYYSFTPAEDGNYPVTTGNSAISASYWNPTDYLAANGYYIIQVSADGSEEAVSGAVTVSKVVEGVNYLEIGLNEDKAVSGEGTEYHVIATQPGRYTITGDGI
ncbi:MAG: hypothetical protein ACI3XR_02935, partial [Eubacteriales bacterium]